MGGMGLRKMSDSKQVVLVKQFWRMIINPNSLISSIWKQKYLPTFNLHEVRAVTGCSFTWRSILASQELIDAGEIGSAQHVKIWTDRWIPRSISFRVIIDPNSLSLQAMVNKLIDGNGSWNVEVIWEIFRREDVDAILVIPLDVGDQDLLRWHFKKHDRHSIRSGYKILRLAWLLGLRLHFQARRHSRQLARILSGRLQSLPRFACSFGGCA
ncbi:UNVERIFIED_CONTAM: hypothetical protein Sradi_2981300 [Sesamum radiatum]|uniref:Uncharacterized protein n=1 Tax=Sesamum radiatum TaxID=300843 RepID=A0AAW2S045_SESRA